MVTTATTISTRINPLRRKALTDSTILLISPERWADHNVSKHHYARELGRQGARVYFLNPPESGPQHIEAVEPNVWVVRGPEVAKGLRFYPPLLRNAVEARWLRRLEARIGEDVDVVWNFENSRFFDLRFAGHRLKIYHQVDLNQSFNPLMAARTADICFCTTDIIREKLLAATPHCHKIHHGLAQPEAVMPLTQAEQGIFEPGRQHALYIGNLECKYIDRDLLKESIETFSEVIFHMVGGYREGGFVHGLVQNAPNVRFWGKVPYQKISSLIAEADVLLVAYTAAHHEQVASPHKFMEYLASGKPVCATYTAEYENFPGLIRMARTHSEFAENLRLGLESESDASECERRIEFAKSNTYTKQLERINQLVRFDQAGSGTKCQEESAMSHD